MPLTPQKENVLAEAGQALFSGNEPGTRTPMTIVRTRLSPHLGVELTGIDLSQELTAATRQAILDAWIDAGVLLFRGLGTSPETHMRLSEVFGELEPAATRQPERPEQPLSDES